MLPEDHPATAYHASNDQDQAKPPDGVEGKDDRKGKQGSREASDGSRVGGDFPPDIDECAKDLYDQCCNQDACHEMWNVKEGHDVIAEEIAKDGNDIG